MKKLIIVTIMLLSITTYAQKINWMSFEEALTAQKTTPKKIFVDAYTTWCGPCKMLDKNTFQNKDVVKYINDNFYAVKFNAEGNEVVNFKGETFTNPNFDSNKKGRNSSHQLSGYLGVRAYPTMLFLDEENNLITPVVGYKTPQQLELFLKLIKKEDYKNIKSQEAFTEYASNFKPEFKE
ncbi:thioredoxin family protein [Lutibacter sp.]|uniref:thioredoxin family protein n=1 Tax=Lutibacter sp. TaxID=1925666 RepID=UPI00356131C8